MKTSFPVENKVAKFKSQVFVSSTKQKATRVDTKIAIYCTKILCIVPHPFRDFICILYKLFELNLS
jgi:hypothetical protein